MINMIKQRIFIAIEISSRFITHFFVTLAFLCLLPSSIKYAYALASSVTNSVIIFPPNSSLKILITLLFLCVKSGLYHFHYS